MSWPQTVRKTDLRIDYYRGSGKGGQHKNKTDSACRITHLPTGTVGQAEDERKQPQNKKLAWKRLCAKLVPLMKQLNQTKKQAPVNEVVRTYHKVRNSVKDHRIPDEVFSYERVIEGKDLEKIIEKLSTPL